MKTVKQVATLTGVSVRTLHYYDELGLLTPSEVTAAGYRLYGDDKLERLQQILFFRELDFPLREITRILDSSDFSRQEALRQQKRLLTLKRDRLEGLLRLLDDLTNEKEGTHMAFEAFDTAAIDAYAAEAKERWGGGEAYRQSAERTAAYPAEDWNAVQEEMGAQFARFAALRGGDPAGEEAQAACEALRRFISCRFYDCTKEILAGLGAMYIEDERFRESIDRCGEGTARFAGEAIAIYCAT